MKKRALILTSFLILFASVGYAPCWYPQWGHSDYWQFHQDCAGSPPRCDESWSLDGTCDYYCDGTSYCTGDTEYRWRTIVYSQSGNCDLVCE